MKQRIIDRKTWHEVITDEMDWVLVELGACKLLDDCVSLYDPRIGGSYSKEDISVLETNFNEYCHQIISPEHFPDELSFNQVITILNNYLQGRWEEFKRNG